MLLNVVSMLKILKKDLDHVQELSIVFIYLVDQELELIQHYIKDIEFLHIMIQ